MEIYHITTREQDDGSWIAWLVEMPEIYVYGQTAGEAVSLLFLSVVEIEQEKEGCV